MNKKLVITLVAIFVTVVFAGQKNLYEGDSFGGPPDFLSATDPAYYKDGTTPCANNCLIQGVIEGTSSTDLPPTTNTAYFYVQFPANNRSTFNIGTVAGGTSASAHPYQDDGCGAVGGLNGLGGTGAPALGNYKMGVGGNNNTLGWLRIFSSTHPTNSAYYGDGDQIPMPGSASYGHAGDIVCSNVNPVYIIPALSVTIPADGTVGSEWATSVAVTGLCGTATSPGNNQLADNIVSVKWETVYLNGATETAFSNGWLTIIDDDWFGSVGIKETQPNSCTNIIKFRAFGESARAGLPISREIEIEYINVPEPALFIIFALFVVKLYTKTEIN